MNTTWAQSDLKHSLVLLLFIWGSNEGQAHKGGKIFNLQMKHSQGKSLRILPLLSRTRDTAPARQASRWQPPGMS
jgi:hypothetical protein